MRGPYILGTTTILCSPTYAGLFQYNTVAGLEYCNGTNWVAPGPTTTPSSLSNVTNATAAVTIANTLYSQTWTWNTLTTQTALALSTNSATNGSLMAITNTNTASNTGPVVNITTQGIGTSYVLEATMTNASTTGYAGYFNNASTTGWGVYSAGTSPNYFGGNFNIATAQNYQINGVTVLTYPYAGQDTTGIAVGQGALVGQTSSGNLNTAVGVNAFNLTNGIYNLGFGYGVDALTSYVSGITAVGYEANGGASGGNYSESFGSQSDYFNAGQENVALGYQSAYNLQSTYYDVAVGDQALYNSTSSIYTTAIGYQALYNTNSSFCTALGYQAAYSMTDSGECSAFGYQALYNATGTLNEGYGYQAAYNITSGTNNTAAGYQAMYGGAALTGSYNVAIGNSALYTIQGVAGYNTAVGAGALYLATSGNYNTAIGYDVLYNATGSPNDGFGYEAGYNITTGFGNVAFGYEAMFGGAAITGGSNTAIGSQALYGLQGAAANNTAIGYQAGYAGTAITTGTNNTFVGYQAQSNGATYTNGTALGYQAILTASNVIVLGNSAIAHIYAEVTTITGISDRRLKRDIADLSADLGLDFIEKLKPVSYRYNNGDETERYGFIAQDLEEALPSPLKNTIETAEQAKGLALIERQNDKDRTYNIAYGELTAPIVKAIQEQSKKISDQHMQLADLKKATEIPQHEQLTHLENRLASEESRLFFTIMGATVSGLVIGFLLARRKGAK